MPLIRPAILIVDDRPSTAQKLGEYLVVHEASWDVEIAASPAEAITQIRSRFEAGSPFAVLITDLVMEHDDPNAGVELIKESQKIDRYLMTLLYSGYPERLNEAHLVDFGIFDIVGKAAPGEYLGPRMLERTKSALRYREWAIRNSFLRRYFDPNLFETIEERPSELLPRNRDVTIVFWDIRGFSALCGQLREETALIAGFLRDYCQIAARRIFEHGGVLDKFIGDGVMALFGFLDDDDDRAQASSAIRAVGTAVSLHSDFRELVHQWTPKWERRVSEILTPVRLACGVHTGRALVGNMGTEFRDQFTAVGSNVNFAQRLESMAGKDAGRDILISQTTKSLVEHHVPIELFRDVSDVKNVPGVHRIFSVKVD